MPYPSRRLFGMPLNKGVWLVRFGFIPPFIPPLLNPQCLKGFQAIKGGREGDYQKSETDLNLLTSIIDSLRSAIW